MHSSGQNGLDSITCTGPSQEGQQSSGIFIILGKCEFWVKRGISAHCHHYYTFLKLRNIGVTFK